MFAIQGQQFVVQQQLHFVHGLFDAFWGELTFPDDDHLPAVFLKHLVVILVAFSVAIYFVLPEIHIGLGQPVFVTTLMSMPEASIDEDGDSSSRVRYVRSSRGLLPIQTLTWKAHLA